MSGQGSHRTAWIAWACCSLLLVQPAFPQATNLTTFNTYKVQPEVWHLVGPAEPGVDGTGDLSLSIPLLTIPGRGGLGYDVALSYHSGITVDQEASWIGLGWNFDPGSITREPEGGLLYFTPGPGGVATRAYGVDEFDAATVDGQSLPPAQPDVFYLHLPGRGTVAFTRAFVPSPSLPPTVLNYEQGSFVINDHKAWKVEATYSNANPHSVGGRPIGFGPENFEPGRFHYMPEILRFVVTTDDGMRYVFAKPSLNQYETFQEEQKWVHRQNYVSTWRLVAILGTDYWQPIPDIPANPDPEMSGQRDVEWPRNTTTSNTWPQDTDKGSWIRFEYTDIHTKVWSETVDPPTVPFTQTRYLKAIVTPTYRADFSTRQRRGPAQRSLGGLDSLLYRRLTQVTLQSRLSNTQVQKVLLDQDNLLNPIGEGLNDHYGRLRLKGIRLFGKGGAARPGYTFSYYEDPRTGDDPTSVSQLKQRGAYLEDCIDDFGYVVNLLPFCEGRGSARNWSLKRITYPSGGSDTFEYEDDVIYHLPPVYFSHITTDGLDPGYDLIVDPNPIPPQTPYDDVYYVDAQHARGGVRVSGIVRDDGLGAQVRTNYAYPEHGGQLSGVPPGWWRSHDHELGSGTTVRLSIASNRGKIAVFYDWVDKATPGSGKVRTHYTTSATKEEVQSVRTIYARHPFSVNEGGQSKPYVDIAVMQDNRDWNWGLPLRVEVFEEGAATPVRETTTVYDLLALRPSEFVTRIWEDPDPHIRMAVYFVNSRVSRQIEKHRGEGWLQPVRDVEYVYDAGSNLVVSTIEKGQGENRITEVTHAYKHYGGTSGLEGRNMLSQTARDAVFSQKGLQKTCVRSTVTTWKHWAGEGSFWKPHRTFNWLYPGTSVPGGTAAPDFNNWSSAPFAEGDWILSSTNEGYDEHGNLTAVRDARGYLTTLSYQGFEGAFLTGASRGHLSIHFGYDTDHGRVNAITDEAGATRTFSYDNFGRLKQARNASDKLVMQTEYFDFGGPAQPNRTRTQSFLGEGVVETWAFFDGLARPLQNQLRQDDGTYAVTGATEYDGAGRPWKTYLPYFASTNGSFDSDFEGRTESEYPGCDRRFTETSYYPDPLARVKSVMPVCPVPEDGTYYPVRTSYEILSGLRSTFTEDEDGHATRSNVDAFGQTVSTVAGEGEIAVTTEFQYNVLGNLVQVTDPEGLVTRYVYNTLGQLVSKTTPDAGTTKYLYDRGGNLRFVQDANGAAGGAWKFIYYKYDPHNRVRESGVYTGSVTFDEAIDKVDEDDWPRDSDAAAKAQVTKYRYDTFTWAPPEEVDDDLNTRYGGGRLTEVDFDGGYQRFFYDAEGRVEDLYVYYEGLGGKLFGYAYDLQGNVRSIRYQAVAQATDTFYLEYVYDRTGQLKEVWSNTKDTRVGATLEAAYNDYTAAGQVGRLSLGTAKAGGAVQTVDYKYHPRGWLTQINDPATLGDDLFWMKLGYDTALFTGAGTSRSGNVAAIEWSGKTPNGNTLRARFNYTYDGLSRLTSATFDAYSGGSWSLPSDKNYDVGPIQYSRNGNLKKMPQWNGGQGEQYSVREYRYVAGTNRLDEIDLEAVPGAGPVQTVAFAYDPNGNATRGRTFSDAAYDYRNLPSTLKGFDGRISTYRYDPGGQRIAETQGNTVTFHVRGADGRVLAVYRSGRLLHWNILAGGTVIGRVEVSDGTQP